MFVVVSERDEGTSETDDPMLRERVQCERIGEWV